MAIEGVWKSQGYGWRLKIDEANYAFFDSIPGDCVEFERGGREEFSESFDVVLDEKGERLTLQVQNELSSYTFDRVQALPDCCLTLDAPRDADPLRNFNFFCTAFSQDYAFFEERKADWRAMCAAAQTRVSPETSPDQLFSVLADLIEPLKDNHVSLIDGSRIARSEKVGETKALLRQSLGLTHDNIGHPESLAILGEFINSQYLGGNGKSAGNGSIIWGMLSPQVGYLNVLRLYGFHDSPEAQQAKDLPARRNDHARFLRRDLDAAEDIFDGILKDLSGASAIILDIRLNGGGFDKISLAIANRFTDRRRLAFTKEARLGDGLTPSQNFYIEPDKGRHFNGPVYVLTANRTSSAGDILALSMRALPHATLLGQPSNGILSDNLAKHMPNGWRFYISNEIYRSPHGEIFEACGVPVHITTPVFLPSDFVGGYKIAIDAALSQIEGRGAPAQAATANR